jgi:hypothetical protein
MVTIKIIIFWNVTPRNLLDIYRRFGVTCCFSILRVEKCDVHMWI